jgi:hypothetical protein
MHPPEKLGFLSSEVASEITGHLFLPKRCKRDTQEKQSRDKEKKMTSKTRAGRTRPVAEHWVTPG